MDQQGIRSRNSDVHIQNHAQIRRHHKAIIMTGGKPHDQRIIKYLLSSYLAFISPQGSIREFSLLPGNVFPSHGHIDLSRVQGDGIFGNIQGEGFVRVLKDHGNIPQRKIPVGIVIIIQGLYRTAGAGIRLHLAGSGNLVTRG